MIARNPPVVSLKKMGPSSGPNSVHFELYLNNALTIIILRTQTQDDNVISWRVETGFGEFSTLSGISFSDIHVAQQYISDFWVAMKERELTSSAKVSAPLI